MAFISAYAPQSGHKADDRLAFFTQLVKFYSSICVNRDKSVCGAMNAYLRYRYADEDGIIGDYFFAE